MLEVQDQAISELCGPFDMYLTPEEEPLYHRIMRIVASAEKEGYLRGLAEAEEIAVEVAANKHGSAGFVANKIAERRRAAE